MADAPPSWWWNPAHQMMEEATQAGFTQPWVLSYNPDPTHPQCEGMPVPVPLPVPNPGHSQPKAPKDNQRPPPRFFQPSQRDRSHLLQHPPAHDTKGWRSREVTPAAPPLSPVIKKEIPDPPLPAANVCQPGPAATVHPPAPEALLDPPSPEEPPPPPAALLVNLVAGRSAKGPRELGHLFQKLAHQAVKARRCFTHDSLKGLSDFSNDEYLRFRKYARCSVPPDCFQLLCMLRTGFTKLAYAGKRSYMLQRAEVMMPEPARKRGRKRDRRRVAPPPPIYTDTDDSWSSHAYSPTSPVGDASEY